ncbi:MAG: glycosyltransferase [Ignavibacteriae bacterium]|nr:glycosyltransferase [Ignavibacteriota bacterium]MCB9206145.1 glycosyltransferase [Ignavibacteriales bacterium]MCB9209418.1 glycosyltransferase [Ignavibacteriales bacterium]MCB9258061.1 glycosyltransferase [Ignavibacteriales bacterium]
MANITLSMIVKNEEKYLRECLESVQDIVDEIVVVDTGSSDKTLEIAEDYNPKIYHFEWINDFSAARNFALSKSTGNWILYLDADERLDKNSIEELKKFTKNDENIAIKCIVESVDENSSATQSMLYTRLFKNSKAIKFSGKVHEQIEQSLIKNNYKIIDSKIKIFHLGYGVSKIELKNKAKRNLELLLKDYSVNKDSYVSYQLANSYFILEDNESAIKYYKDALQDNRLNNEFKIVCCYQISDFEMRKNNLDIAKKYIERGLRIDADHPITNMIASQIFNRFNDKKSLKFCKNALIKSKNPVGQNNIQNIFLVPKKIIYEGILQSLKFNSKNELAYYIGELKNENTNEGNNLEQVILNAYNKNNIKALISYISNDNVNEYLQIFEYLENVNLKLELYSNLYDNFRENPKFLNKFGSFLIKINQINEAKVIFETALNFTDYEDSTLFYLVSIYINNSEFDQIQKIMPEIDNKISNNSIFKDKFQLLKDKITPLV